MSVRFAGAAGALVLFALAGPVAAIPPVEDYGRLPAADLVALSPSGDRYAYVSDEGGGRKVVALASDGKVLLQAPVGTTKVREVEWAGEDIVLVTVTKTYDLGWYNGNYELSQVLVVNIGSGKTYWVFQSGPVVNSVFGHYGVVQHDGRWYGHFGGIGLQKVRGDSMHRLAKPVGEPDDYYPDLFRVDLATGEFKLLSVAQTVSRDWLVGADGEVLASAAFSQRSGSWDLWAGENGAKLAEEKDSYGAGEIVGFGRTLGTVLYKSADENGDLVFREAPVAGGGSVPVAIDGRVSGTLFDRESGLLIGAELEGDQKKTIFFAPKHQARFNAIRKAFPAEQSVTLASWNATFDKFVVFTQGVRESGSYWLIDTKAGRAEGVGLAYPTVAPEDVGPVRMINYKAADGLELQGVLTLPPGGEATNLPLVVLPHGGPASRDYLEFDWWAQAFASRGYAVFQPNFRGSSGYGRKFMDHGFGEWGRKMQTDVSDGVAALATQGVVDPKRVCIVGASYGGYAALAGVTVQQGLYRCAVSYAGVADPAGFLKYSVERQGRLSDAVRWWKDFMGAKSPSDPVFQQISPLELADRADAPVLLIHGKDDTVVPSVQSRDMARAVTKAGKPVELVELEGEDHWLSGAATRTAMLKAAVAFVEKHNPADPAPPAKAAP